MKEQTQSELLDQALLYFKRPCFERLFEQLYQRCYSLGRLGGTVKISRLRADEADALEGFLQKDCHGKKEISISVGKIRKALLGTKYKELSLEDIVTVYFRGSIVSKKDQQQAMEDEFSEWLRQLEENDRNTPSGKWMLSICHEHIAPYMNLASDFRKNKVWIQGNFPKILKAINQLPCWKQDYQKLPIFAASISGNPHFLDVGERTLLYLLYGICAARGIELPKKVDARIRRELLYQGGLLTDDLSNIVLTYGMYGVDRRGIRHQGMESYVKRQEALNLTISNLTLLGEVRAEHSTVYIVENPMIFDWLMEQQKERDEQVAIICSAGQPNQAVWILLDLLHEAGTRMYYAGDFDPEGLLIAQRMKDRYQDYLQLWHYTIEDYESSKSQVKISNTSLKKLRQIRNPELLQISEKLLQTKLAGYQENLLSCLLL